MREKRGYYHIRRSKKDSKKVDMISVCIFNIGISGYLAPLIKLMLNVVGFMIHNPQVAILSAPAICSQLPRMVQFIDCSNSSPLKIYHTKKECTLPTIIFQGPYLTFGRISFPRLQVSDEFFFVVEHWPARWWLRRVF